MKELKPCPFCGSKAEIYENDYNSCRTVDYMVECSNDDCGGGTISDESKERAIAIWNHRTDKSQGESRGAQVLGIIIFICVAIFSILYKLGKLW